VIYSPLRDCGRELTDFSPDHTASSSCPMAAASPVKGRTQASMAGTPHRSGQPHHNCPRQANSQCYQVL
ncbi:MAG: hypothetical protein ACPL7K_08770, partial [Armatimonadota bacterium]